MNEKEAVGQMYVWEMDALLVRFLGLYHLLVAAGEFHLPETAPIGVELERLRTMVDNLKSTPNKRDMGRPLPGYGIVKRGAVAGNGR